MKRQVTDWLTAYKQGTVPDLFTSLGLSASDAVPLSATDIDRILTWVNSRSLHFGHSAFLALKEYLFLSLPSPPAGEGQGEGVVPLAVRAILQDILTGVITPKTTGDLEISLATLSRIAKQYGVTSYPSQVSLVLSPPGPCRGLSARSIRPRASIS